MKRKLFVVLLACIMMTASVGYAAETDNAQIMLSQMTEEECVDFIVSQGVSLPEELRKYEDLGEFVKDIIVATEADPNIVFTYNYHVTLEFANEIKAIVNAYYGNVERVSEINAVSNSSYALVDNETVGAWVERFTEYNCYAYVWGYNSSPNEDPFMPYPGSFSTPSEFDITGSVERWGELTVADLHERGYSCVYTSNEYEDIMEYADTHVIICLRKGHHPDFHYMLLRTNGWYHKPGRTHVLRYLYNRPDNKDWIKECSISGKDYPPAAGEYYCGTIVYFAIQDTHILGLADRTGNHYHEGLLHYYEYSRVCQDCGAYVYHWESETCSGPPCMVPGLSLQPEEFLS